MIPQMYEGSLSKRWHEHQMIFTDLWKWPQSPYKRSSQVYDGGATRYSREMTCYGFAATQKFNVCKMARLYLTAFRFFLDSLQRKCYVSFSKNPFNLFTISMFKNCDALSQLYLIRISAVSYNICAKSPHI